MYLEKEKMIDLNKYSYKEIELNVNNAIRKYHNNKFRNKIFKELNKIDESLVKMRIEGLSITYIKEFISDYFGYKVGVETLTQYYKIHHKEITKNSSKSLT